MLIFQAADLISGPYRAKLNAATMIGQSKSAYQAEIDSAGELIDFLRFNVQFMQTMLRGQPASSATTWNRIEYNPLEGFVLVRYFCLCLSPHGSNFFICDVVKSHLMRLPHRYIRPPHRYSSNITPSFASL